MILPVTIALYASIPLFASQPTGSILEKISPFSIVMMLAVGILTALIVRSILYRRKHPRPVAQVPGDPIEHLSLSMTLLSISLVTMIIGTIISVRGNDAVGGALATVSSFVGLYEQRVRHRRAGHPDTPLWTPKSKRNRKGTAKYQA